MACPRNSITYNATLCACPPGYLLNATANACNLFTANTTISTDSGVDYYAFTFPNSVFSFDSIKKFTQSQAIFLEATAVLLLSWLIFCSFLRFMKLGDGNNVWFQLRWWISRLDICFATKHWLEDQRVVKKRKTELGGTLSIASWILFTGLFAALLYQIITKRSIEVHNVRAVNAPDLAAFSNDMEFNITTVSSMTCANLRNLGELVTGSAGFFDYRVIPLTSFANFSCHNTSEGPTITLRCSGCRMTQDNLYISWEFVDLPNSPATAVGYKFNLSSKPHGNKKHLSFVSGTLRNGSTDDDGRPVTYRGSDPNILKFNLFPRLYHNLDDLRLIQPLLHDFLPGSVIDDLSQLRASLENTTTGLVNTTLYVNFLSSYIVEIDKENILGPVSFLADLGGLYCISIGIFYYLLVQFEFRVKKLRNEDSVLRKIRNRRKAQERWNKLRKYVRYRWACRVLDEDPENYAGSHCINCIQGSGSLHSTKSSLKKKRQRTASIGLNRKENTPTGEIVIPEHASLQHVKTCAAEGAEAAPKDKVPASPNETHREDKLHGEITSQCQVPSAMDIIIPPPPSLELLKPGSETEVADIQRSLTLLYEYNLVMREKLVATQSLLRDLSSKRQAARAKSESVTRF